MSENKSFLRNIIGEYMSVLGERYKNIVIVNADLAGTCRNKSFVEKYPERSFNTGIAEQNMVSFGAGLACEGFKTYVFSMAPFLTMRACEQCRTDVSYGNRDVKMIGVYAGVSGGISGATHWGIEDCGIMTSMPNVTVFEISDAIQAKKILDYSAVNDGPMYIRSSVEPALDIYSDDIEVKKGGSLVVKDGEDGVFLCSGVIVQYALEAANRIQEKISKQIRVVDMYSIKPIDENAIVGAAKTGRIVVAQDHNIYGGLGSMVAKVIAEKNLDTKFMNIGVNDKFVPMAHAGYLYHYFGMDADGLENIMLNLLKEE